MIDKWAQVSQLTIREETDSLVPDEAVEILIGFVRRYHFDPYPFDGPGGTLAHAYYPHNNKGKYSINSFHSSRSQTPRPLFTISRLARPFSSPALLFHRLHDDQKKRRIWKQECISPVPFFLSMCRVLDYQPIRFERNKD